MSDKIKYPRLYGAGEIAFADNGLGFLPDALSCIVREERNGEYYLEMTYRADGLHAEDIASRSIILARPNPYDQPQPFRVQQIVKTSEREIEIYAPHVSYDLSGTPCEPFTAANAPAAMQQLKAKQIADTPFTFETDKQTVATMTNAVPTSCRALLGGHEGSVLDTYGGEWEFDRWRAILHASRGEDRGAALRYGKNIATMEQEQNIESMYTAVYPYWLGTDGVLVTLPEKTVSAGGTYSFSRVKVQDFSADFETPPTEAQLRGRCQTYIGANKIGVPAVTLDVTPQVISGADVIKLCDTVHIYFAELGVKTSAEVIAAEYNLLTGQYNELEIGTPRYTFVDAVIDSQNYVATAPRTVQEAVNIATGKIVGNVGGYVVLNSSGGGKYPDEILVMDAPRIEDAVSVWRWNKSGLGHSSSGYNGPYTLAALDDGSFVADVIKSGTLASADGTVKFNLQDGTISTEGTLSNGKTAKVEIAGPTIKFYIDGVLGGWITDTGAGIEVSGRDGSTASIGGAAGTGVGNLSSATRVYGSEVWIAGKKVQWVQSTDFGGYVLVSK